MVEAFIAIGANLGDRGENIKKAIELLGQNTEITIEKVSSIKETEPAGGPPQPRYLNGVIKVKTVLGPQQLFRVLQDIENRLGREKTVRFGPRIIDLDILLYGDKIISQPDLEIPHPRMGKREFVMEPLREIEPDIETILKGLTNQ
ncbi:MAG: 2-amino-4-hydroxy-6-hydroxymethyldihydropteridine diphosphokinase [Candidatus Omnitrophota bacterium]|nr:MAG: 2-amino-4-hydroxy-6-hydroxymethyldihydropteridine diphosphokinase [Candidatus Omnitrophota bacterium]